VLFFFKRDNDVSFFNTFLVASVWQFDTLGLFSLFIITDFLFPGLADDKFPIFNGLIDFLFSPDEVSLLL